MEKKVPIAAQYIKDFEQLGFGMFVHFGMYSQLNKGEWAYHILKLEKEPYLKLQETFDVKADGIKEIVATGKAAGCKYITLTTRHHEGFSLYDTCGLNEYDALHSPTGRDLIKEFVEECRKAEIVPFFYHTTLDWIDPRFEGDFDAYLKYLYDSVEILCTRYGKIGGLWFDGNWSKPDADWKEGELYAMIRRHQPEAMIINNTGLEHRGEVGVKEIDAVTYERGMPHAMDRTGMDKYLSGEMCETLCDHWGIADDFNFKPIKQLIEELCECRKVGANFLLNIGPAGDGSVPKMQAAIMETLGEWMKIYGKAIYNGRPYLSYEDQREFALVDVFDPKTVYLFKFNLGKKSGSKHVSLGMDSETATFFKGFEGEVESIQWMDNGEDQPFAQEGDTLSVDFIGYPYGQSHCVRVAEVKLK